MRGKTLNAFLPAVHKTPASSRNSIHYKKTLAPPSIQPKLHNSSASPYSYNMESTGSKTGARVLKKKATSNSNTRAAAGLKKRRAVKKPVAKSLTGPKAKKTSKTTAKNKKTAKAARNARVQAAIDFLRSKKVLSSDEFKEQKFARLIDPSTAIDDTHYVKCQDRLLRLYDAVTAKHEPHSKKPRTGAHVFSKNEFPGYIKLQMVNDVKTCMQRWQQSRLCYMHAPVVLQYYAIWHSLLLKGTRSSKHGVMDVARYIAERFSSRQLEQHVFDDSGGSSKQFLEAILEPGSILTASVPTLFTKYLSLYGPGLVSNFKVFEDFKNETVHKHHGMPVGLSSGQHAMVLVGARTAVGGGKFFLLQNW